MKLLVSIWSEGMRNLLKSHFCAKGDVRAVQRVHVRLLKSSRANLTEGTYVGLEAAILWQKCLFTLGGAHARKPQWTTAAETNLAADEAENFCCLPDKVSSHTPWLNV